MRDAGGFVELLDIFPNYAPSFRSGSRGASIGGSWVVGLQGGPKPESKHYPHSKIIFQKFPKSFQKIFEHPKKFYRLGDVLFSRIFTAQSHPAFPAL